MAKKKKTARRKAAPARGRSRAAAKKTTPRKKSSRKMAKDDGTGQDLDQVRDLLFGAQMRESDKRFAAMEERLHAAANDLRDEIRKRFDSLEQYVKSEVATLGDQLKKEQSERTAAVKQLVSDLASTAKSLEKFADKTTQDQQKLRGQLHDQGKQLTDAMQSADSAEAEARMAAVADLSDAKADRVAIAGLLNDMAVQLAGKSGKKK